MFDTISHHAFNDLCQAQLAIAKTHRAMSEADLEAGREPQTAQEFFEDPCGGMEVLSDAIGLENFNIQFWSGLDGLGLEQLEGAEYFDATALLAPSYAEPGFTVKGIVDTPVEGNTILDVLRAIDKSLNGERWFFVEATVDHHSRTVELLIED